MASLQGCVFRIRQLFVPTVGFVRGSDNNLLDQRRASAGFKHRPRSSNVGFESAYWVAIRDAYNCLSGEVKDGINFVFADRSLYRFLIANVSSNNTRAVQITGTEEFILGYPVSYECYDECASVEEFSSQPTA